MIFHGQHWCRAVVRNRGFFWRKAVTVVPVEAYDVVRDMMMGVVSGTEGLEIVWDPASVWWLPTGMVLLDGVWYSVDREAFSPAVESREGL